ncbi:TolC family protein [Pseudomonas sp. P42]|uniref:TolC family protein n=1 Tax=Pseudomonas sp. P42 TaxID=1080160 RepID=UPI001B323F52|nr:TolC family protein [Pseudomonas sp. P42]
MTTKNLPQYELRAQDLFAPRNRFYLLRSLFLCLSACASSSVVGDELLTFNAAPVSAPAKPAAPVEFKAVGTAKPAAPVEFKAVGTAKPVAPVEFKPRATAKPAAPVEFKAVGTAKPVAPVEFKPSATAKPATPVEFRSVTASQPVAPAASKPSTPATSYSRPVNTVARAPRSNDGGLQFSKVTDPATVTFAPARPSERSANTAAAPRDTVSTFKPVTTSASAIRPSTVPGVSALGTSGLPVQLASRQGAAAGPSEQELKGIFHRAVQAAAERSPTVQRAHAELAAADADIDEAKGQRYPQVDLGTTAGSKKFGSGSENSDGSSTGINLNVVTPVYDWGRIRNTIDSRRHLSTAATAAIDAELENSAFEVTTTLVELGKQRIIVDLSQQYVDRMNELVKMLAGIVAVDKGRSSELTQAKARQLQAQAARDSADTRARDAEITLRKLVGDRPIMIPRTKEWNIRLANLDHLLSKTEDHPVINQAKAQTESAELQAKVVRSGSLPQLNWVVSKSTAEDSQGREQPWETHLAVTWGAFRGGSVRASERAALQRAEASRQEVEQQRLDLEYRIRTANHEARTFLERAELYRDLTVETDGIRVAFYEQWYHLGKRTLLDVLSAESDHYGNRVSEITNRFDGYQAILRQYAGAGTLSAWLGGAER